MRKNIWNSNVAKYIDEHRTNIISEVGQQHFPCPLLNHYFCYSSCSMLFIRIFVFFQIVYLIYLYNRRDFIYLSWKELFFAKIYLLTFLAHCEEKNVLLQAIWCLSVRLSLCTEICTLVNSKTIHQMEVPLGWDR